MTKQPEALNVGLVRVDDIVVHPHNLRQNLGDLRTLAASIKRYGVIQPVVVEKHAGRLRLRAGHRRVAAARLAGLTRVPAVIHSESLDDEAWLIASVQENVIREGLKADERLRTVHALLDLGCSRQGVADTFGVAEGTVTAWLKPKIPRATQQLRGWKDGRLTGPRVRTLIAEWRERDCSRERILAELEALFPAPGTKPGGQAFSPRRADAARTALASRRAGKVEAVRDLVHAGNGRAEICARLRTTSPALARFLIREGEHELARPFGAAGHREAS